MSGQHRRAASGLRRRLIGTAAVLAAAVGIATTVSIPGANGAYSARITNSNDTASSNPYFTCAAAAQGETATKAYFSYPFGESGGVNAADVSGNGRTGAYSTLLNLGTTPVGVTYGVSNSGAGSVCPRDKQTVITLDGLTGYVSGPNTQVVGPNTFSVEIWFKTTVKQGVLIGFGDQRTGLSGSYDRHLYIDTNGRLVFGVFPNAVRTLTSSAVVTDGNWHQAVGTLSSAGMALYLDGVQVGSDSNTTSAQPFNGYWRVGFDTLNPSWVNSSVNYYFNGQLAFGSVYPVALSAAQVKTHFAAGR